MNTSLFFIVHLIAVFELFDARGNDCAESSSRSKRDGVSVCPPPDHIKPCVCNANYNFVTCRGVEDEARLREIFSKDFSNNRITKLVITESGILKLSAGVFGRIKIHDIEIRGTSLSSIEPNAFSGSERTTLYINLNHNKLETFSFQAVTSIRILHQLHLSYNKLTEIPDFAFGNLIMLDYLTLDNNHIRRIGKHAFQNLHSLTFLDLSRNSLLELGQFSMSFSPRLDRSLSVVLNHNNISSVDKNAFQGKTPTFLALMRNNLNTLDKQVFKPIIDQMLRSSVVGLAVQGNPIVCDCHVKWISEYEEVPNMNLTLRQFQCVDGRTLGNLTSGEFECS